jgi:hypothetical protein
VVASLAVVALAGLLAGCSDDDTSQPAPSTTRPAPSTVAPADGVLAVGDEVTDAGAELRPPAEPETRQIDAEAACRTFLEPGGEGTCELVATSAGPVIWTLDPGAEVGPGEREWAVRVWTHSETMPDGGWQVALHVPQPAGPPRSFANVAVRSVDLTGDGQPELLVGYRAAGTGQFESYDVVTFEPGAAPVVGAHREGLHKGSVTVEGTDLVDFTADESSPECCPRSSTRTRIAWRDGAFRVTEVAELPIDEQPPDLFG